MGQTALIFCFARTSRFAIVCSGMRKARGRDRERFLGGFLGEVEVAEEAAHVREDAAPLVAEDLLEAC